MVTESLILRTETNEGKGAPKVLPKMEDVAILRTERHQNLPNFS
jgi:hypothetical protein